MPFPFALPTSQVSLTPELINALAQIQIGSLVLVVVILVIVFIVRPYMNSRGTVDKGDSENFGKLITQYGRMVDLMAVNQTDNHAQLEQMGNFGNMLKSVVEMQRATTETLAKYALAEVERTASNNRNYAEIERIAAGVHLLPASLDRNTAALESNTSATREGFMTMDSRLREVETGLGNLRNDMLALKDAIETGGRAADQKADAVIDSIDHLVTELRRVGTGNLEGKPDTGSDAAPLKVDIVSLPTSGPPPVTAADAPGTTPTDGTP